jgi:hypothetical protein
MAGAAPVVPVIIGWRLDPGLTGVGRHAEAEPLYAIGNRGVRRADILQVP